MDGGQVPFFHSQVNHIMNSFTEQSEEQSEAAGVLCACGSRCRNACPQMHFLPFDPEVEASKFFLES